MIIALNIQLISSLMMAGLIWFVQVVHYPLFAKIGNSPTYFAGHQKLTSFVVIPLMIAEGISATYLVAFRTHVSDIIGIILLTFIWLSTFCIQVPLHREILIKFSLKKAQRLTSSNWIRTLLWSARGVIVAFFTQ
ncbi:MAG: hypothetical protein KGQ54_05620 [Verrucomicrobia bacterium]|nr:hypothetical protein [Verrucomicrobiota bacterium]